MILNYIRFKKCNAMMIDLIPDSLLTEIHTKAIFIANKS